MGKARGQSSSVREDPEGWALTQEVLRIRSDPGGLAFDDDNANMPLRPAPDGAFAVEVTVEFAPASLYEQAGLVLYASDGDVKLQYEMLDDGRPAGRVTLNLPCLPSIEAVCGLCRFLSREIHRNRLCA